MYKKICFLLIPLMAILLFANCPRRGFIQYDTHNLCTATAHSEQQFHAPCSLNTSSQDWQRIKSIIRIKAWDNTFDINLPANKWALSPAYISRSKQEYIISVARTVQAHYSEYNLRGPPVI